MHFAVIGAGNMGCVYGGNLARIGEQVTMIDPWHEHTDAIRAHGLKMDGLNGDYTVSVGAFTDPAEAPQADVALICVNAYSTQEAAATAKGLLGDQGYALTVQNGLGNIEILTRVLGEGRLIGGLSFHSGDLKAPGCVTHTNNGPTYLGELDGSLTPRLETMVSLMDRAGLNPVVEPDIMVTIYSKFVHNCGINAVCAITGLRPGQIQEVPELDDFQAGIIDEALALVRARGITLPDPDPLRTIKDYCAVKFHRPSMMQHLDRGRPTEIDALNGYVARESAKLGLSAPCNSALTCLMKGRHHIPSGSGPEA